MIRASKWLAILWVAIPLHYATAQQSEGLFSITSLYLSEPIEGFHQIQLTGELTPTGGTASLILDPNACVIGQFGDTEDCTKINPTSRMVALTKLRTADPLGRNRSLWLVSNAPISGNIFLVTSSEPSVPTRLVYAPLSGNRQVIWMQQFDDGAVKALADKDVATSQVNERCKALARTVDGTEAFGFLRPGFLNGTYFLMLDGKKPNAGTQVTLKPVIYTHKPDYWRIDIEECAAGEISLPVISPYNFEAQEITNFVGKKGVELFWNNGDSLRLEK